MVDAVDIFGAELEALGLHVADDGLYHGREPHSFVGHRRERYGQCRKD